MTSRKNPRNPGDIVTCACPGCVETFVLKIRAMHQLHCSRRCRAMAAKAMAAAREPLSRNAKSMRMEAPALGGTTGNGEMVSGSLYVIKTPINVADTPQHDARFW